MSDRETRRQQILDRARVVFAKKGYHAAKIDDIVAAAGVARGTFYLYFHDKRAIFEELVTRFFQKIAMSVSRIDTQVPIEPQIVGNVARVIEVVVDDPAMSKILLSDAMGLDVEFDQRLLALDADLRRLLTGSLREGQELGIVRPGDPELLASFVMGGVKEVLLQLSRAGTPVDRDATAHGLYAVLERGIVVGVPTDGAKVVKKTKTKRG